MEFLTDEHVPRVFVRTLRSSGHDVKECRPALGEAAADEAVLAYCASEGRVLITHDCSYIAVEQLIHIRDRMDSVNGRVKRQMHNWAFRELQEQIEWKAAEYGIRVEDVNPAFSSQTCSKCGHQSSTNRNSKGWFACNECGYELDGDYNAAKNIGARLLTVPEGERPSGLGDGQLTLKSGTMNGNGSYIPSDVESADRESTGKPTTSVVGR